MLAIRVVVESGCVMAVYAQGRCDSPDEVEAEVFDLDGDNAEDYQEEAERLSQSRDWVAVW